MTILIIVLGVSGGVMTATESAAIAALWAFVCAVFIYRDAKLKEYYRIATSAVKMLSIIMILMAVAYSFSWVLSYLKIPKIIAGAVLGITDNKYLILLLVNILVLLLGCVMSISSIILILTPILVPIFNSIGVDLVHFGVVFILNLGIGLLTPPVGAALYVGSAVSGLSVGKTARALLPFYLVMVAVLFVLTYVPEISTWLPKVMGLM